MNTDSVVPIHAYKFPAMYSQDHQGFKAFKFEHAALALEKGSLFLGHTLYHSSRFWKDNLN